MKATNILKICGVALVIVSIFLGHVSAAKRIFLGEIRTNGLAR